MRAKDSPMRFFEKKKSIYFQIGLIVSLSLTLVAFEWTSIGMDPRQTLGSLDSDPIVEDELRPFTIEADVIEEKKEPKKAPTPEKANPTVFVVKENDKADAEQEWSPLVDNVDNPNLFPDEEIVELPVPFPQVMPCFSGCEIYFSEQERSACTTKKLNEFINRNFDRDRLPSMSGKVYVELIVGKNGKVRKSKIVRDSYDLLNEEALRIVKNMPHWNPGRSGGHEVAVIITLPIEYKVIQ